MGEPRGYVLAGGRSSRMGVDKAEMRMGGRTLLEIAVGKLREMCGEVVVVGERPVVPAGVRVIADRWAGCGPLGGMEAALADVGDGSAMFLPVDMPLVPEELLAGLARVWLGSEAPVCLAVVDGRVQPLLSLVRGSLLGTVRAALERGEYKVRPALETAGVVRTEISTTERERVWAGWVPGEAEWAARAMWFGNLNTPEEFGAARRFGRLVGRWENGRDESEG